jgi:hypothetical protein
VWRAAGLWDVVRDASASATNFDASIFSLLCRLPNNGDDEMTKCGVEN